MGSTMKRWAAAPHRSRIGRRPTACTGGSSKGPAGSMRSAFPATCAQAATQLAPAAAALVMILCAASAGQQQGVEAAAAACNGVVQARARHAC